LSKKEAKIQLVSMMAALALPALMLSVSLHVVLLLYHPTTVIYLALQGSFALLLRP
jgi:hypothetical protein